MGIVATLGLSQLRQNQLKAAFRDRYTALHCADWDGLLRSCAGEAVTLAVIDLFAPDRINEGYDALRQLKRRFPSIAVVLYVSIPPAQPRDLFEAGRFGVDGLIIADKDDGPRQLLSIVEQAEARGVVECVRRAIGDVKPTVRDATLIAVTRSHQRMSPDSLAKILGVRRKTLSERLSQAGYPTAQRLIAWGRMIVAARMLEDVERSADSIAMALDFPSGSAFRNTCQRYLQATPQEIRAKGGSRFAIDAFLQETRNPVSAEVEDLDEPDVALAASGSGSPGYIVS
ncbi:MAG: helix-turn-helix domain-containing protein [Gemmatimonadaceae bacterium]